MNLDRWRRIRELTEAAAARPAAERAAWLESLEPDAELRARVLALVDEAESDAGTATQRSTIDPAAIAAAIDATVGSAAWAGRRIGPWRLVEAIGRGGMGEVWRAERVDGGFRQDAALKLMRRGVGDAGYPARFEAERQILARLEHPNIARLLDGGALEDGQPWLALEFIRGTDLIRHADARRLGVRQRVELFLGVCAAVAHAHRLLVVHRDLKPSNVMVTPEGTVKLLDFGIAKLLPGAEGHFGTETAAAPLTPAYAAPEQLKREPIGTQTDVYALGLLLHELLTGVLPHRRRGSQSAEALVEILTREPAPASVALERHVDDANERSKIAGTRGTDVPALRRALRGDLDAIIAKALRTRPEDRYASVDALAEDLRHHLERRPVAARRGSWRYRAGRFVARHRVAVALAGLLVASLAGGLASIVIQAREVARERDRALLEGQRANAALAFQREIFRRARPATHLGREPSASELLDLGERLLTDDERLDAGVRATLLEELSGSRWALGQYEAAHVLALKAQGMFAALGDHRGELRLDIHLASLDNTLGRPASARERIDRVLAAAPSGVLPPPELYAAYFQHGILLGNAGDTDGADRAISTAIELATRDDPLRRVRPGAIAGIESIRAGFLSGAGRAGEALARLRETRDRLAAAGSMDEPARHQLLHGEALALELLGRYGEAAALVEERLGMSRRIWGPTHEVVAQDLRQLARLALRRHDLDRAIELTDEALPIARGVYGEDSAFEATLLHTLALARLRGGHADTALELARRGVDIRRRTSGEASLDAAASRAVVVMALEAAGRLDEAATALSALRAAAGERWGRLPEATRARLDAFDLHHGGIDAASRCADLAALRQSLADPTAVAVVGLYLAACRRDLGDSAGARAVLSTIESGRLAQLAGDPALARLRTVAEGRRAGATPTMREARPPRR